MQAVEIHGDYSCDSANRFFCVVCWQLVCWCKGCEEDPAIEAIRWVYDPGICDECVVTLRHPAPEVLAPAVKEPLYTAKKGDLPCAST